MGLFLFVSGARQQALKICVAVLTDAAKFAPKYHLRINPPKRHKTPKKGFKRLKMEHGKMLNTEPLKLLLSLY